MKKIFFTLFSACLALGGGVFAQGEQTVSLVPRNLPVVFSGDFTLELGARADALSGTEQFYLHFSQCGSGQAEVWYDNTKKTDQILSFSLFSGEEKQIPLLIKADEVQWCQLNFSLRSHDQNQEVAQTSIVLNPSCHQPIDFDQEQALSGVQAMKDPQNLKISAASQEEQKLNTELNSAFERAVQRGLVENSEAARKRFSQPMTRMQFAQMVVAIGEQLGLEVQQDKVCDFSDLQGLAEASSVTAQKVCQLNVMGIHPDQRALENFMPDQLVNRAQMITVLSRMLRGKTFNEGGKTFYEKHLAKGIEEKIITHSRPSALELQGYFYLVLQRAEEKALLRWR